MKFEQVTWLVLTVVIVGMVASIAALGFGLDQKIGLGHPDVDMPAEEQVRAEFEQWLIDNHRASWPEPAGPLLVLPEDGQDWFDVVRAKHDQQELDVYMKRRYGVGLPDYVPER